MLPGSNFVRTKFKKFQLLTPDPDTIYFLYDIGAIYLGSVCVGNTLRGKAGIVISDSEPNDPDHPVWLDPDGEVGPLDLDITGASVGQVPAVKAVDENGVPTEWEAVEPPSSSLVVNLTMDDSGNITADKTFAEIKAAHDDGKVVDAKFDGLIVPLSSLSDSEAIFAMTNATSDNVATASLFCTSDNVWSMSQIGFDAHTLGISGASAGQTVKIKTVDSSGIPTEWEPADMPSGSGGTDTSLGLTGATVGQTVKIKAVDENGIPTEWEAVDAASGGGSEWKLLRKFTLPDDPSADTSGITWVMCSTDGYTNQISQFEFDTDESGNTFALTELMVFCNHAYGRAANYFGIANQNGSLGYGNLFCNRSIFGSKSELTKMVIHTKIENDAVLATLYPCDNYTGTGVLWAKLGFTGGQQPQNKIITAVKLGTFVDGSIKPGASYEIWGR